MCIGGRTGKETECACLLKISNDWPAVKTLPLEKFVKFSL